MIFAAACGKKTETAPQEFNVEFEKFKLDNGLEVIFHIDKSDPVVAVSLTAHVGSAREKKAERALRIFSNTYFF